jgi:hypothetical protein
MLNSLARFSDQEIPVPADADVSAVREFFRTWRVIHGAVECQTRRNDSRLMAA